LRYLEEEYPAVDMNSDADVIGGSSIRLPDIKGPAHTILTFRAYAPPSIDKEIPKVDLVGTMQFVKTGKVRTFVPQVRLVMMFLLVTSDVDHIIMLMLCFWFVPQGSKRLLVVNFQDLTIELYLPKQSDVVQSKPKRQQEKKVPKHGRRKKSRHSHSGIHLMSERNLIEMQDDESDESDDENLDDEKAWDRKNFEPRPAVVILLSELISVSAVPPIESSVLEVSYKVATSKVKKSNSETYRATPVESPNKDDGTLEESSAVAEENSTMMGSSADLIEIDVERVKTTRSSIERRVEFAFLSPHNAAEFQRIVMVLRTSGRDLSHLYEMLEEFHVNSEGHFPQQLPSKYSKKSFKVAYGEEHYYDAPQFCPAGIALDDAWRCMNEIPNLRMGLLQYHQYSYNKIASKYDDLIVTAAQEEESGDDETNGRKRIAEFYSSKRTLIGIVDFIFLFMNPLPLSAISYVTPCGASDVTLVDDLDGDVRRGINLHHQRLESSFLLQQLVSKASAYVVAYYRAKLVVQNGWYLLPSSPDSTNEAENKKESIAKQNQTNLKRLAFDNDRDNWAHDIGHRNEIYEASVGKDVFVLMHGNVQSKFQGFAFVSQHTFRVASSHLDSDSDWLHPSRDPVECIPSLRGVIDKFKDRQFIVVSYFNKYSAIATCHLFVRSLPVGVDRAFDTSIREFVSSSPKQRNKKLQVSFQFAFDQGWSSVRVIAIRTAISIIFRWFFGKRVTSLNKGLRERLSCPREYFTRHGVCVLIINVILCP
jgi:hypothetical protein